MTDHDLVQRIRQAITLKDRKQVRALLGQAIPPGAPAPTNATLLDAIRKAADFLTSKE